MKPYALFLLLAGFFTFSCVNSDKSEKEIISVSILPQKYMVEKIAGDKFKINVLVPPGASPETYELSPSQMRLLTDSRFYFITGHLSFEKVWKSKFESMDATVEIVDISEGIDLISINYAHEDHFHIGVDPHIWISPKSVQFMADNIYRTLIGSDPDNEVLYTAGYREFSEEISKADSILTGLFSMSENKAFLIFHPALGYLARDYNLEQIPVEYEGKSPPPSYLMKIVDLAREKNIRAILIQKEFSTDNARSVAREIDGEIIVVDPLEEDWFKQIVTTGETLSKLFNSEK